MKPRKTRSKPARQIATRRNLDGRSAAPEDESEAAGQESAAERRLQSLLKQLDRIDGSEDEALDDPEPDDDAGLPQRRWSEDE